MTKLHKSSVHLFSSKWHVGTADGVLGNGLRKMRFFEFYSIDERVKIEHRLRSEFVLSFLSNLAIRMSKGRGSHSALRLETSVAWSQAQQPYHKPN